MYELDLCGSGQGRAAEEWRSFVNTVKELLAYSYVRGDGKYHDYLSN